MFRPVFRKMPRHLTCIALATADFLLLLFTLCTDLLEIITGINPVLNNMILCKLYIPVLLYLAQMDSWFITFLTFDRLLAVTVPFRVNQIVTTFRTKTLLIFVIILFFIYDVELIVRFTYFEHGIPGSNLTEPVCQLVYYQDLPPQIFKIKDTFGVLTAAFIPILLIVPANIFIIIRVYRQKRRRSAMTSAMTQNYDETSKSLWMVIAASLAFALTVMPLFMYGLIWTLTKTKQVPTNASFLFLEMLNRLNPALNAYIYFICGGLFKDEVKNWLASLCPCKRGISQNAVAPLNLT